MNLIELLPKLIEHRVPVSVLNINRRVFFHWKQEGLIDYEPYIVEIENKEDKNSKKVKKWLHLNAFDMLWLLMVKELRSFNIDLKTIKELKTYIPYYELVIPPTITDDVLVLSIKVKGSGDYLPEYAGNLDIINCAAIEVTKKLV